MAAVVAAVAVAWRSVVAMEVAVGSGGSRWWVAVGWGRLRCRGEAAERRDDTQIFGRNYSRTLKS